MVQARQSSHQGPGLNHRVSDMTSLDAKEPRSGQPHFCLPAAGLSLQRAAARTAI